MHRTRIKICGIVRPEDALAAARAGADAIGLVFHPPAGRNISIQRAAEIMAVLPPFVTPVGLFVDAPPARVRETARALSLGHVQLHGHEPPETVAELQEFSVLKAIRVDPTSFGSDLQTWRAAIKRMRLTNLHGIVLETAGVAGGSGAANDWETVLRHRQRGDFVGLPFLVAAGGLTAENVSAVVRDVRPWAVDVSSGVEQARGEKSPERIEAFIAAVALAGSEPAAARPAI